LRQFTRFNRVATNTLIVENSRVEAAHYCAVSP
jgi:hypothetical protein